MIRIKCRDKGHKWSAAWDGNRVPVRFCRRWLCEARRLDPMYVPDNPHEMRKLARW